MVLPGHPGRRLCAITYLAPQAQGPSDFNQSLSRMRVGSHPGQRCLEIPKATLPSAKGPDKLIPDPEVSRFRLGS